MRALTFSEFGPPSVLSFTDLADPKPGPAEVLIQTKAIGLNFADVYRRQGNYHLTGSAPFIAGYEAAGVVVEAPIDSVYPVGARVAFADVARANAELVVAPIERVVALPESISFETAAASLLQGLTAQYLVSDSRAVKAEETALVHAAAGGVGLLLVQMLRSLGARVVGLTSNASKIEAVTRAGAEAVFLYQDDWVSLVRTWAPGSNGVDVVYESVGSTLMQSLNAVRVGGQVVFFGFAAGNPPLVDARLLMDGSKTLTGGDLWNVLTSSAERLRRASALFSSINSGALKVNIAARFPLSEGAAAHALLESRKTSGKVLLVP